MCSQQRPSFFRPRAQTSAADGVQAMGALPKWTQWTRHGTLGIRFGQWADGYKFPFWPVGRVDKHSPPTDSGAPRTFFTLLMPTTAPHARPAAHPTFGPHSLPLHHSLSTPRPGSTRPGRFSLSIFRSAAEHCSLCRLDFPGNSSFVSSLPPVILVLRLSSNVLRRASNPLLSALCLYLSTLALVGHGPPG